MILRGATILDGVDVHIAEGRIRRIVATRGTARAAGDPAAADQQVLDCRGLYLIPGLVNTHSHTAMTLLLGAAEMLLGGVTCVADHYFHIDRAWEAYRESGMRADLAWAAFGAGEGWQRQWAEALEFSRAFAGREPRLAVSLGPHSPYICPESFLRTATEAAGVLRPGTVLAHAATDRALTIIREHGAGIAHCAKTYLKFGALPDILPRALAAGVTVGLGTDGPASNNTLNIFETARDAALLAKCARGDPSVARVGEVLPLCHRVGEVLGLPGYGRVEEGSLADLVLLDPRHPALVPEHDLFANLLYSLGERSVHTVIVDGKVVVREGRLLTIDLEDLRRRAGEIASRLVRAAGQAPIQSY